MKVSKIPSRERYKNLASRMATLLEQQASCTAAFWFDALRGPQKVPAPALMGIILDFNTLVDTST